MTMKNNIILQVIPALYLLIFAGCETIATKEDIDVVQSKVSYVQDDFYATSKAIAERFQTIEDGTKTRFESTAADIKMLSGRIDNLSSDLEQLVRDSAVRSSEISATNNEIRKLRGSLDELDYKLNEELKKEKASLQQRDLEIRRDIEGLKKTYSDIIASISALSKNLSAIQNDMRSLNQSQIKVTDSLNKLSSDVGKNLERNIALEKKSDSNIKVFLNELTRQESEIFQIKRDIADLNEAVSKTSTAAPSVETQEHARISSETRYYTVKKGDYLGKIASQFKTTVKAIKDANNLKKDTIYIGQRLVIP